jgi:hypothetical protein
MRVAQIFYRWYQLQEASMRHLREPLGISASSISRVVKTRKTGTETLPALLRWVWGVDGCQVGPLIRRWRLAEDRSESNVAAEIGLSLNDYQLLEQAQPFDQCTSAKLNAWLLSDPDPPVIRANKVLAHSGPPLIRANKLLNSKTSPPKQAKKIKRRAAV